MTIGVNTDRFARSYKAKPLFNEDVRWRTVSALRFVNEVLLNDGPGADLIRSVKPDVLVVGSDWLDNHYLEQIDMTREELDELGTSLVFVPRTPGVSSSQIRLAA